MAFDYSVSVTLIFTIHPTSFDYGILLNVNEQMFHRFHRTVALTMINIMVNKVRFCIVYITILIYSN